MSIFQPGINKAAYQGKLTCPFVIGFENCGSTAIRYVEHICPTRIRYRCRKCGHTFQYDISNRRDINPYAAYSQKSRFGRHLAKMLDGRKLKGGITL